MPRISRLGFFFGAAASIVALGSCVVKRPLPADTRLARIVEGEDVLFKAPFDGYGRACGTCVRAEDNLGITLNFVASLPSMGLSRTPRELVNSTDQLSLETYDRVVSEMTQNCHSAAITIAL